MEITRAEELTEPEEAKGDYQDHLFLILCKDSAIPAMVGDDASRRGAMHREEEEDGISIFVCVERREKEELRFRAARDVPLTISSETQLPELQLMSVPACRLLRGTYSTALVMCCSGTEPAEQVHVRRFDGIVHVRRVPVRTDASPDIE
jgi:hypothetical protein